MAAGNRDRVVGDLWRLMALADPGETEVTKYPEDALAKGLRRGQSGRATTPDSCATITAWTRSRTLSLVKILATWVLTVVSPM